MIATLLLLMICPSMASCEVVEANRRAKRIAFGSPLPSLDTYKIYYFVQLRRSWACFSDQTIHEDLSRSCQEDYHLCGAALIHPEFVLTAAHCIMYFEVVVQNKFQGDESWVQDWKDYAYYYSVDIWERVKEAIIGIFIVPKPRHTVYTDYAMFSGSHDWFNMKQKRHVVKVFPHHNFPQDLKNDAKWAAFQDVKKSYHDIALLQACQPFKIKSGEVELAPMLRTHELLQKQFEHIVRNSLVCLYLGFGDQDNERDEVKKLGYPMFPENLMLHTWRPTSCSSECNKGQLINETAYHTCSLCSHAQSNKYGYLGTPESGDSGSPVTCEGKYVATFTSAGYYSVTNYSRADSYPIFCIFNSITENRLNYYKTVDPEPYHPLSGTRLRRFSSPP